MGLESNTSKAGMSRLSTPFSAEELEAIDAWGFSRRMRNRSDVIRELVKLGLATSATDATPGR